MSAPGLSRSTRAALLAIAALPLAVKAPYIWRAWVSSPIDRAHLNLFGLLSIAAVAVGVAVIRRRRNAIRSGGVLATAFLIAVGIPYVFGVYRDVNALQLIAGVCILWSAGWFLFGRMAAAFFAPAALFAILAVPGTMYWMRNASSSLAAAPCAPFAPEFSVDSQKGMLGRELQPSAGFTRFFRTSSAHQFMYASPSNSVSVLAVTVGDDIHEIHPATHCMRSAGWRVVSEGIARMERPNGGALEVDEAVVESIDGRMLVWIWYSSDAASTGSFLHFRRMHSAATRWRTYQIATSLGDAPDALADARGRLERFLESGDCK